MKTASLAALGLPPYAPFSDVYYIQEEFSRFNIYFVHSRELGLKIFSCTMRMGTLIKAATLKMTHEKLYSRFTLENLSLKQSKCLIPYVIRIQTHIYAPPIATRPHCSPSFPLSPEIAAPITGNLWNPISHVSKFRRTLKNPPVGNLPAVLPSGVAHTGKCFVTLNPNQATTSIPSNVKILDTTFHSSISSQF